MTWKREPGVAEIVARHVTFISERPRLASLLYDLDMRTEQLAGLCEVYREMESAEARAKQAEELLKPFADLAAAVFRVDDDGRQMNEFKPDDRTVWGFDKANLTYGHLRAVARFLENSNAE